MYLISSPGGESNDFPTLYIQSGSKFYTRFSVSPKLAHTSVSLLHCCGSLSLSLFIVLLVQRARKLSCTLFPLCLSHTHLGNCVYYELTTWLTCVNVYTSPRIKKIKPRFLKLHSVTGTGFPPRLIIISLGKSSYSIDNHLGGFRSQNTVSEKIFFTHFLSRGNSFFPWIPIFPY